MRKNIVRLTLGALLLALSVPAEAQQPAGIPRIGFLTVGPTSTIADRIEAFRQGLRELGYVEGKNIVIEWRSAEGNLDHLPALVAELVRLKVDVIVSGGPAVTRPAKNATSTIPIVMGFDGDPVRSGFVASLARPGGNITGLSILTPEISGKRLELIKETVPGLSRVAVLGTSTEPGNADALKEIELAARALRLKHSVVNIPGSKDIETVFRRQVRGHADAILVLNSALFNSHRSQIVDLAIKSRLPAIYDAQEWMQAGGLMSYGVNVNDLFRRAATYVDKILKGRTPADLPVEQAMKFELVFNLKAAKQIGLTIPPNVLVRADRFIR